MAERVKKKKTSASSVGASPEDTRIQHHTMMPYKFEPYQAKADEVYMNDKQLQHFRSILEAWKKELMKEVDNTIIEMKEASITVLADPNDRATQEETFNLELRTRDRERKLIRKIEEALQQIK